MYGGGANVGALRVWLVVDGPVTNHSEENETTMVYLENSGTFGQGPVNKVVKFEITMTKSKEMRYLTYVV